MSTQRRDMEAAPSPLSWLGGEGCDEGAGAPMWDTASNIEKRPLTLPSLPSKSRWGRGFKTAALASLLVILALTSFSTHAIDPLPFKDRAEEVRFQNLTRQLRCLVCQNQDLADSDAALAGDLRKQVFEMMRGGKSDDEIKQYLVARYNDFVLYDPPLKPGTWLLWFAPLAFVLAGAFALVRIVRARARAALAAEQPKPPTQDEDW